MFKVFSALTALLFFCNVSAQNFDNLTFGTDSTLDVVTWNIEHFPKNGQTTIDYVTEVILAMDIDVIAMQEIDDVDVFDEFIDNLDGYDGFRGNAEYARLGYIYKTSEIQVNDIYEIITFNSQGLPRPPIVMELTYDGMDLVLINNHFKCCGDGVLEESNPWDEESRRLLGVSLLEYQLENTFANERVVLLGDLNDVLTDSPANNVFQIWLDNPNEYLFADMDIAEGDEDNWSYPSWPSHLDHIMLTDELFEPESDFDWTCDIVRIDDAMGSWFAYDNNISDHRPVSLKLDPKPMTSVGLDDLSEAAISLTNYPNPFQGQTNISANEVGTNARVLIFGMDGKMLESISLPAGTAYEWNAAPYGPGIYFAHLLVDGVSKGIRKMVAI
jgi:endonuclease/exonuclease/phosphatase family metal-dependent hydrolase